MAEEQRWRDARPVNTGSTPQATASFYEKSWALVVGISDYGSQQRLLPNAQNDAEAVGRVLKEVHSFTNITELYNDEATAEAILARLRRHLPEKTGPHDRLILFFSGHGGNQESVSGYKRGYLVPYDAPTGEFEKYIDMKEIQSACSFIPAKHIFIILDCCFSGIAALTVRTGIEPTKFAEVSYFRRYVERPAWQILTAGAADEPVADSGLRPGHSAFTSALIDGLSGEADQDRDGIFTAMDLAGYVSQHVSKETQGQTPFFSHLAGSGQGNVVFKVSAESIEVQPVAPADAVLSVNRAAHTGEHVARADSLFPAPTGKISPEIVSNLPYPRNRFFLGREELLERLHGTFVSGEQIMLVVLTGLGGIGKTQTAVEYAYRYQHEYRMLLWAN